MEASVVGAEVPGGAVDVLGEPERLCVSEHQAEAVGLGHDGQQLRRGKKGTNT